jgi:ATPase subunit of ABC transporter with duplicated ATPase domains
MFRVLGGATQPKRGDIRRTGATGYLSQDPRSDNVPDDTNCLAHVLSGRGLAEAAEQLEKLRLVLEEDPSDANIARFSDAQERFELDGGYAAESEVRRLVDGLGLRADRLDVTLGSLSGGERRRLELARILFAGSDLLLLDEPTNHLDIDAKQWLMQFLRSFRGGLLVISHDLDLLDQAITRVLHIDEGELVEYRGTYSQYLVARKDDAARRSKLAARQSSEIDRLKALANSMRGQTEKRARTAKTLDHRVEKLTASKVTAARADRKIRVRLPEPPRGGRVSLEVADLAKAFGTKTVFEDVTFDVGRGERMLVLGLNGAGKTTLLKTLVGELEADLGTVALGHQVSLGYYAQEHEGIVKGRNVLAHMRDVSSEPDQYLRSLLGMFGLHGEIVFQDASTLSGGEKTKLALTMLVAGHHNLLLLDEPTNNLDPASRIATGQALAAWPGTMIVVSHDAEFVRSLAPDRALMMPDGTLDYFDDEMLDLLELV